MTISAIAWSAFSRWFQSNPAARSQNDTMPIDGANMKSHNTPATAAATA